MMGIQEAPARLFYDFDLEAQVPANHMLRQIDHFLDVGAVREALKPRYSHLGRPSIDPELIVRMLVIGYPRGAGGTPTLYADNHVFQGVEATLDAGVAPGDFPVVLFSLGMG